MEAQLYEGENYNAELALPGPFDWAFVLTYLAPLFVIVLLHDLASSEREAGRMALLQSLAQRSGALWARRIVLRLGVLYAALFIPFVVAAIGSGAGATAIFAIAGLAAVYLLFWALIALWVGNRQWSALANAATLSAVWMMLTLVLPTLANLAINAAIPVRQGVELTFAQREAIHGGWDRSKDETMQAFFRAYPEYADTTPLKPGFQWKWYYAFQQVGDMSASAQAHAYRDGLMARNRWTGHVGVALPAVGVQTVIHWIAETDLSAQLAYQDRIRAYHERLRRFYYGYLFADAPFRRADFVKSPRWSDQG